RRISVSNACESPAAIRPARSISSERPLTPGCVAGIADLYDELVALDARRLASVPALATPPLCLRSAVPNRRRRHESIELTASDHPSTSKRGEPLREGRLWRSRRSGRRGRVGGVGSTLAAAPGCPALTTWVRHAEALRAAAHPASRRTRQTKKSPPGGI